MLRSYILVLIQFALLIFLAWYGGVFGNALSGSVLALAVLLGTWAVATMRFRVSILPEVRSDQRLITFGPYRFIRHPMYTAVLLMTLAWVMHRVDAISLLAWLLLLFDLLIKMSYEEKRLREKFPDYAEYAKHTKRLIPLVY